MVNKLINYSKIMVIPIGVFLITPIILSIINILGLKTYNMVLLTIMIITSLITGFFVGKKADKNGYINGLLFGILLSLFMFIFSLLFKNKYGLDTLIFYFILIVSNVVGAMIGIQKNTEKTLK